MRTDEKSTEQAKRAAREKLHQAISLGTTVHQALKNVHDNGEPPAVLYDFMVTLNMQLNLLNDLLEPDGTDFFHTDKMA